MFSETTLIALTTAAIIFLAGTIFLVKKGYERHFILFMIRTRYGLKIVDRLSKLNGWKFIADFAIAASLGGMGALYLAIQDRRSLYKIFFIFGVFLLYSYNFFDLNLIYVALFLILLALLTSIIQKIRSPAAHFFIFSLLTFLITKNGILIFHPIKFMQIDTPLAILISIFGLPAFIIGMLVINAVKILFFDSVMPGVSPLIPSVKDGSLGFGFLGLDIFIPLWYGLISIIVLIVAHEMAHGILARVHDIKIKSTGLLTVGILPIGAFVEPDEEEMKKKKSLDKMRVYVIGSSANFVIAVIATIAILSLSNLIYTTEGVKIVSVENGTPAYGILQEGMVIYSINGKILNGTLIKTKPYENITLQTNKGNFTLTTGKNPKNETLGFIGIIYTPNVKNNFTGITADILAFIMATLFWISILNFGVGLTNLMPIIPFDGGKMIEELMSIFKIDKTIVGKIIFAILALGLFLILINFLPVIIP